MKIFNVLICTAVWTILIILLYMKHPIWAIGVMAWTEALSYYTKRFKGD